MTLGSLMAKIPQKPDAFDMFCYASEYREAAKMLCGAYLQITQQRVAAMGEALKQRHATPKWMPIPGQVATQVLLALSIEIYLKCLRRVRGRAPLKGHVLRQFFAALSLKDRRAIQRRYAITCKTFKVNPITGKKRLVSIESALARAEAYFLFVRYGYELPTPRAPFADGSRGNSGMWEFVDAVRAVILDKHPDWETLCLERKSLY
jgi:hypothetical protein